MSLSPSEQAQLRALVYAAWPHRGTPRLAEHCERIVEWNELRALATIDLGAMRMTALEAVETELRQRTSVDVLIELLRRTRPAPREVPGVAESYAGMPR